MVLIDVGEVPVRLERLALHVLRLQADPDQLHQHVDVELIGDRTTHEHREALRAGTQLHRTHQVRIAPRARLRLVAELLEGIGLQQPTRLIGRIGEHEMVEQFRRPSVITLVEGPLCFDVHLVGAAHRGDVTLPALLRRVRVEVGRVAVVPADVALIHRLCVVAHRPVVATRVALGGEAVGLLEILGDLAHRHAMVRSTHCLVVQPAVHVALQFEIAHRVSATESRPVVGGEEHIHVATKEIECLLDVLAPTQRVSGLRPTERQRVVHRVGAVLGDAERAEVREHEVHLCRRFSARRVLEHDPHAIEHEFGSGECDLLGRCDQVGLRTRNPLAEAAIDMALRTGRQQHAELIEGPAAHGGASDQVFGDGLPHEPLGRQDTHIALVDLVGAGHAENAAVMIGVAVGVQHGRDGTLPERGVGEIETRLRRERRGERIDDHPPLIPLDEGDIGDVVAARLPDVLGDLK